MRQSSEQSRLLLENQNTRAIEKDNKKDKLTRLYILSQVDVLIAAVIDQNKKVVNFLEILKQEKTINLEFPINVDFTTRRIRIIDSATVFEIFVLPAEDNSNHLDSFNSLLRQLDLIDSIFNSFNTSLGYIVEHFRKYESNWNDNLEILMDNFDQWRTDLVSRNIDPRRDMFLAYFFDYFIRWSSTSNHLDMYVAVPNLINPVLQKGRESQPNQFGAAMIKPLLRCMDAFDNVKNLKKIKIEEYEMYKTQLGDISQQLLTVKTVFDSV
jgi:hypothetical protein